MSNLLDDKSLYVPPRQDAEPVGEPGVLADGVFWYFDEQIDENHIRLRKTSGVLEKAITYLAVAGFIVSLAFLVLSVALVAGEEAMTAAYWQQPTIAGVFLWLSVLTGLFVTYRLIDPKIDPVRVPVVRDGFERTSIGDPSQLERTQGIGRVLSEDARGVVDEAYEMAKRLGHAEVESIHLFAASLGTGGVGVVFARLGITFSQIKEALQRRMLTTTQGDTIFSRHAQGVLADAFLLAVEDKRDEVSAPDIWYAAYVEDEFLRELLYSVGSDERTVKEVMNWVRINEQLRERYEAFRQAASFKPTGTMDRAYTAVETPLLNRVSVDLTRAAVRGQLPLLIDRDREMSEILRAAQSGQPSVVLVGQAGVGRRSILYGIAEKMVQESVPERLQDKRLLQLDVPLIASAGGGVGAEERLLTVLREVGASGNIVIVIEDIDALPASLMSVLAAELDKGYTMLLATASLEGYTRVIERSPIKDRLQKIVVPEPERDDAIRVLQSKLGGVENQHKVFFTYEALAALVELSDRYMREEFLPKKAIDLAREVAIVVGGRGQQWARVMKKDVADLISQKTQIPVSEVGREEGEVLLDLEARIHERVIGQEEAVKAVSAALRRARTELRSENRPIANFLFLGPTGVGKTELAKATAEVYFGNEDAMLRFDMSEFQDQSSIERLIGGNGEGGVLTEAVRKQPFALLLLDELEKAHPDILNLFLQVMDDGRLTDGTGKTIDFTNVILIATSNAGANYIQDAVAKGLGVEEMKAELMERELRSVYRPEFLNRFDGVIVFTPLSEEDVVAIAYLMVKKLATRLEMKGMHFEASDEAIHELALKGFDPKFGARPLRRVIQETVDNAIAEELLKGTVGRRDTLILNPGGTITVRKAEQL